MAKAILLVLFVHAVNAEIRALLSPRVGTSPGTGISKSKYSVTDPHKAFAWMKIYLPVHFTDNMWCDKSSSCGSVGRASLCLSTSCTEDGMRSFGIHTVNASQRPDGGFSRALVEAAYDSGLNKGSSKQQYDHYMDFATLLFAKDLDSYITAFEADSVMYLPSIWKDELQTPHSSIIVQIPSTQVVFELVSNTVPTKGKSPINDELVRLPSSAFSDNPTSSANSSI